MPVQHTPEVIESKGKDSPSESHVVIDSSDEESGEQTELLHNSADDEKSVSEAQDSPFIRQLSKESSFSSSIPPHLLNRPPFVRRYSVVSRKHAFEVTNYGNQPVNDSSSNVHTSSQSLSSKPKLLKQLSNEKNHQTFDYSPTEKISIDIPDNESSSDKKKVAKFSRSLSILDPPTAWRNIQVQDPSISVCRSMQKHRDTHHRAIQEIARTGRAFANRKKDRLVNKNGDCHIVYTNVDNKSLRFLSDFFTTVLEIQWRYHFLAFFLVFAFSWLVFAMIWWGIAAGDLALHSGYENSSFEDLIACVDGVDSFPTALLFSIETQHTIGYGTRAITTKCSLAVVVLMLQSMYGVIMQCVLTGIIFAKMARPKRRAQTIIFSERAVISQRDGQRYLMFRVGDMRKSQIIGTSIKVLLAEKKITKEGEILPIVTRELPVTTESGGDFFFLAWPISVMHRIDEVSPLWGLSSTALIEEEWELIVVLEGVAEVTGASFQVRTSYLPSEILWGYNLDNLLNKKTGGQHEIDYTHFHKTVPVDFPTISARRASMFHKDVPGGSEYSIDIVKISNEEVNNNINNNNNVECNIEVIVTDTNSDSGTLTSCTKL